MVHVCWFGLLKNQSKVSSLKQFALIFTELYKGKLPKFPLTAVCTHLQASV
jgi:hypothetical protein